MWQKRIQDGLHSSCVKNMLTNTLALMHECSLFFEGYLSFFAITLWGYFDDRYAASSLELT